MKNFIEVTNKETGMKVLLPVPKITAVFCDKAGKAFVELGLDEEGKSSGVLVMESYGEIKEKIKQTECNTNGNFNTR